MVNAFVFLAGRPSHGYGSHEHLAGCRILADAIQRSVPGTKCDVVSGGWPASDDVLDGADTIVMYCDGGKGHPALQHLPTIKKHMDRGAGFVCLHYGVEVPKEDAGQQFLEWLGGYFEMHCRSILIGLPNTRAFLITRSRAACRHFLRTMNGIFICAFAQR